MFVQIIAGKRASRCYYLGMKAAGFVLVGGRSSRMGQNKALLRWQDQTLFESIAAHVCEAAGNVALVGELDSEATASFDRISDVRTGLGPLAGIEAALMSARGQSNLILACDLPFIKTASLKLLLKAAEDRQSRCVVAQDENGRVHPLCGVYRSDCLSAVSRALDKGRLKVMETVEELGAERVELAAPIWNVNTPEEWKRCQELANG